MAFVAYERKIPVKGDYDVIVAGGGPSGFIAAIAAARSGARTAVIERNAFLGGTATAGMVAPISVCCFDGELVQGGIHWEFIQRLEAEGGAKVEYPLGNVSFSPEKYKLIAARMVREAGVKLYLHTSLIDCHCEGGRIRHVLVSNKEGLGALRAKIFIDATGDADLAFMAGARMRPEEGELQPASLIACLGGIDFDRFPKMHHSIQGVNYHIEEIRDIMLRLAREGDIPCFGGPWLCYMMDESTVLLNMTRRHVNFLDADAATESACQLREDAHRLVEIMRENVPGFENVRLMYTAEQVGVRETRHIRGVHTLTGDEFLSGCHFPDAIGRSSHPVDIHSADSTLQSCSFLKQAGYIPYRSIITESISNLLVPCRAFSADRAAFASCRVQAPLMGLGQAAGFAAAQCVRSGCGVQDVDIAELRKALISAGANI